MTFMQDILNTQFLILLQFGSLLLLHFSYMVNLICPKQGVILEVFLLQYDYQDQHDDADDDVMYNMMVTMMIYVQQKKIQILSALLILPEHSLLGSDAADQFPNIVITRTLLKDLGADVLVCSAYKFFGPHLGLMAFNKERLRSLQPSKVLIQNSIETSLSELGWPSVG